MTAIAPDINISSWHAIHKVLPLVQDIVTSLMSRRCGHDVLVWGTCVATSVLWQIDYIKFNRLTGSEVTAEQQVNESLPNTHPHLKASLTAMTCYTPCHEQGLKPMLCDTYLSSLLAIITHMLLELLSWKVGCSALSAYAFS